MINYILNRIKPSRRQEGDTIVEVLIAIAVAAFAIGISYAIANNSIQNAVTARERNEALNIAESQIADLKGRYQITFFSDPAKFNANFAVAPGVSGPPFPAHGADFCLLDGATDPNNDATWLPKSNPNIHNDTDADNLSNYSASCIHTSSTSYYIDITTEVTASSANSSNRTVYKVAVRWATIGSSQNSQLNLYYRF